MGRKRKASTLVDNPYIASCPFCRLSTDTPDAKLIRTDDQRPMNDYEAYAVECQNCFARGPVYDANLFMLPTTDHDRMRKTARNEAAEAWMRLSSRIIAIAGYVTHFDPIRFVMNHYASDVYGDSPMHERWNAGGILEIGMKINARCPWCENGKSLAIYCESFDRRPSVVKFYVRCGSCCCRGPLMIEVEQKDRGGLVKQAIDLFNKPEHIQTMHRYARDEAYNLELVKQALLNQPKRQKRQFDG